MHVRMHLRMLVVLLACGMAHADESRLGNLIRWYLNEKSPGRREDFLEDIERLTGNDVRKVVDAIRNGEHFRHEPRPTLRAGGKLPAFDGEDPEIEPVAEVAGDFARLVLPEGYDPTRAHPLVLDLGRTHLGAPDGAVLVRVNPLVHPQARTEAWAAELLVMSLLAHLVEVVNVDPDRVFLRADGAFATLVWYIALHNPDRFAGVLGARSAWKEGAYIAPNSATFSAFGVRKHDADLGLHEMFEAFRSHNPDHRLVEAPEQPADYGRLVPEIERWLARTRRTATPRKIELIAERGMPLRAYWLEMLPESPSRKTRHVGRHWEDRITARVARIRAEFDTETNVLSVDALRVNTFAVYVGLDFFDPGRALGIRVNGARQPFRKVIFPEIPDLLEDYRKRRDTKLLYVQRILVDL